MTSYQSIDQSANRKNLRILLNLRGIAFCAQVVTIFVCYLGLNIVLPVMAMVLTASVLALFNVYSLFLLRSKKPIETADLFTGLVIDVLVLALQLYFSGGTYNPFVSFFMLPVIIGAVMLEAAYAWAIYGLTIACYLGLAIIAFYQPVPAMMDMPGMEMSGHDKLGLIDRSNLHMNGMMLGYAISAGVLVFMIASIRANLKSRAAELEAIKAQALEEDHFIRMGLLSAGAAHELGTPLTTLSVILKDLIDLPLPRKKADLLPDLLTMEAQINRCKSIVSGILMSSGEVRGEGAEVKPLDAFMRQIIDSWKSLNPGAELEATLVLPTISVVADQIIAQMLVNILNNAQEAVTLAGRGDIRVRSEVQADRLMIEVRDTGPGFSDDILARIGQPYITTKAQTSEGHGRGLGLFLVSNAARKLGGSLKPANDMGANLAVSGAIVQILLPLAVLRVEAEHDA